MCVVSAVMDHYLPLIPDITKPWPQPAPQPSGTTLTGFTIPNFQVISQEEIESLRKLIAEFKEAVEAAKVVDRLTNQPDCVDPEKKKLEDRVALLEQEIAKMSKPAKTRKNVKRK